MLHIHCNVRLSTYFTVVVLSCKILFIIYMTLDLFVSGYINFFRHK